MKPAAKCQPRQSKRLFGNDDNVDLPVAEYGGDFAHAARCRTRDMKAETIIRQLLLPPHALDSVRITGNYMKIEIGPFVPRSRLASRTRTRAKQHRRL